MSGRSVPAGAAAGDEPLTLGTAGHVDHGKSALVRALTGTDTDRLPEERARGLSIELGYAALTLAGGVRLSVIDVPGHERFVRTMVAGATGIDLFLMVIAADDGVMPQTREHAAVLAALRVQRGVIAVTKADLIEPELALEEAAELMPGIPAVACASTTGQGLDALREAIAGVAAGVRSRAVAPGPAVLHVDRAFTIRGAGTVCTGTLWSGQIRPGDQLRLLPAGEGVRVRSVQVHDRAVDVAAAGQRVALNLAGISRDAVRRGDAIVGPDSELHATTIIDARLTLRDAAHNMRIQCHHGTRDVAGRLADLGDGYWQLRLEEPVLAARGDRVVVRSIAPPDTLGGGEVIDPAARRHGRALAHRERLAAAPGEPQPTSPAAPAEQMPTAEQTPTAEPAPTAEPPPLSVAARELADRLLAAGHEPPSRAELGAAAGELPALIAAGLAVRVGRDRYGHPEALAAVRRRVEAIAARDGSITLPGLRDELATSRQFAQALLEHLDATRVTLRQADNTRILRGGAVPGTGATGRV